MFSFIASLVHDLTTSLCPDGCSEGACLELVIAFVFALLGYLVSGSVLESKAWRYRVSPFQKQKKMVPELVSTAAASICDAFEDGDHLWLDDLASMDTDALVEDAMHAEVEKELDMVSGRCFAF